MLVLLQNNQLCQKFIFISILDEEKNFSKSMCPAVMQAGGAGCVSVFLIFNTSVGWRKTPSTLSSLNHNTVHGLR